MNDDFIKQWAVEIPLERIKKLPKRKEIKSLYNFTLRIKQSIGISDILKHLEREKVPSPNDLSELGMIYPKIMDLREKMVLDDAKFLSEIAETFLVPYKLMFKELAPGNITIGYEIWVEFE